MLVPYLKKRPRLLWTIFQKALYQTLKTQAKILYCWIIWLITYPCLVSTMRRLKKELILRASVKEAWPRMKRMKSEVVVNFKGTLLWSTRLMSTSTILSSRWWSERVHLGKYSWLRKKIRGRNMLWNRFEKICWSSTIKLKRVSLRQTSCSIVTTRSLLACTTFSRMNSGFILSCHSSKVASYIRYTNTNRGLTRRQCCSMLPKLF